MVKTKRFQIYIKGKDADNQFLTSLVKDFDLSVTNGPLGKDESGFIFENECLFYQLEGEEGILGPINFQKYWSSRLPIRTYIIIVFKRF